MFQATQRSDLGTEVLLDEAALLGIPLCRKAHLFSERFDRDTLPVEFGRVHHSGGAFPDHQRIR